MRVCVCARKGSLSRPELVWFKIEYWLCLSRV